MAEAKVILEDNLINELASNNSSMFDKYIHRLRKKQFACAICTPIAHIFSLSLSQYHLPSDLKCSLNYSNTQVTSHPSKTTDTFSLYVPFSCLWETYQMSTYVNKSISLSPFRFQKGSLHSAITQFFQSY